MMLRHLDEFAAARSIEEALMVTLEQGVYTRDVSPTGSVSTTAFTERIIGNLGKRSERWRSRDHRPLQIKPLPAARDYVRPTRRRTVGADVFVESAVSPEELGPVLEGLADGTPVRLKMVSNRGTKVYPSMGALTDCVDHWRCRFMLRDGAGVLDDTAVLDLVQRVASRYRWMHVEKLEELDGEAAYTRAQGED